MTARREQHGGKAPIITATDFIAAILDPGTYKSWDTPPLHAGHDDEYTAALEAARSRSGTDEAVLTGSGTIAGRRVTIVAGEFAFLAGSIGLATAARIIAGLDRATAEGLPVVASPSSGGTRMQEGTPAFLAMARIAAAVERHKSAGNLYFVYLRHPTTGGAMASWGSLGHMTFAQPCALLGFLGPRVYEAIHGEPFPSGVQTAENLELHGLVDAVVPLDGLRSVLSGCLRSARPDSSASTTGGMARGGPDAVRGVLSPLPRAAGPGHAWNIVLRSRDPERPGLRELLSCAASDVALLESGPLTLAIASFGGTRCVVVGQDRQAQAAGQLIGPKELAKAQRGMRVANELGLPLLTVIDTPGAELSADAEEGGLAREIARCLAFLPTLRVPTLSFLLGQGAGGAAIALLPAARIICAQHAWLAPLPPEGASAILHRDTSRAPELAQSLRITAGDLLECGAVSAVVAEEPDAAAEPEEFCRRAGHAIEQHLAELTAIRPGAQVPAAGVGLS